MPYYPSGGAAGLPLGLAGATGATRYVGATASAAPVSGTFSLGDYVIDQTGKVWVCTVAGTPGTWVGVGIAASGGTPAVVLGTTAAAGVATTFLRDDDTIVAFDTTVPVTQAFSDAAATGSAPVAARRDHKHGMPASPGVTWPLANAGSEQFQPNGVANNVLTLVNNASAANIVTLTGTATGSDPTLVVSGDANRGLVINPAGTGTITVQGKSDTGIPLTIQGNSSTQTGDLLDIYQNSGGNALFKFATKASAVNGITFTADTSTSPSITSAGTSTNINLSLNPKGTGTILLNATGAGRIDLTPATAGNVNFAYPGAAISGSVNPATLATTTGGATGPATAGQNQWLAVKINGTINYLPAWQ